MQLRRRLFSVPTILALDETMLSRRRVVEQTARTDEPGRPCAMVPDAVSMRFATGDRTRSNSFNARQNSANDLRGSARSQITLAQLAAEREDLSELTESGSLPLFLCFTLEWTMTSDYDNSQVVEELEEIAAAAV